MDYLGSQLNVPGFKLTGGSPGTGKVVQGDSAGVASWKGSNIVEVPFGLTAGTNCTTTTKTGTVHSATYFVLTKDVDGYLYGNCRVPRDFVVTNAKVRVSIAAWTATSGVTRLALNCSRAADGGSLNPGSYASAITAQDITVPGTAALRKDVIFDISAVSGLTAADDLLVRFDHLGAHANDTLADDTLVTEMVLYYEIV